MADGRYGMSEYIIKAADWAIDYKGESLFKGCEEIVRCRDCRFSLAHGNGCGRNQDIYDVEPDGFCKWGERRNAAT